MVIKLVKATATFQVVSLSGSVVVVTKPKNLIFSSRRAIYWFFFSIFQTDFFFFFSCLQHRRIDLESHIGARPPSLITRSVRANCWFVTKARKF